VLGEAPALAGLVLADGRKVAISALYLQPTTRLNSPIAAELGCALDAAPSGPRIRVDASQQTTVSGVFAAGDIARAGSSASWSLSDGATAGVYAHQMLIFGSS
jgi:thioredoxin reductase